MASPSEAEIQTMIKNRVDILESTRTSIDSSIINKLDTDEQAIEGDYVTELAAGTRAFRASLGGAFSNGVLRAIFDPILATYGKFMDMPERSADGIFRRLYRRFIDNSLSVKTRAFTFGAPSPDGGNVGTGVIRRFSLDADNQAIEIGLAEAFEAECVRDQGTEGLHEEIFLLRTSDASKDGLERLGTGVSKEVAAVSARRSLLKNPSFTQGTSASSVTSWTFLAGTAANTAKDTTNYYRSAGAGDTATALNLAASVSLQQKIQANGITLSPNVPYYYQIAWNRAVGSAGGTLLIRLGAANTSVTVAAQTGWQVLFIPLTAANCWWKGFKENDLDITIEWTRTSGDLLIDDCILTEMTPFRGQYYVIAGGVTPFMLRDKFTWTDTATEAKVQYWLARTYGRYLPHSGTPTLADP